MGVIKETHKIKTHTVEKNWDFSLFRRLITEIFLFRKASLKKTEQVKGLRKVGVVVLNTVVRVGITEKVILQQRVKVGGTFLVVRWLRVRLPV